MQKPDFLYTSYSILVFPCISTGYQSHHLMSYQALHLHLLYLSTSPLSQISLYPTTTSLSNWNMTITSYGSLKSCRQLSEANMELFLDDNATQPTKTITEVLTVDNKSVTRVAPNPNFQQWSCFPPS